MQLKLVEPQEKAKPYFVTLEVSGWRTPGCFREQLNLSSESRMYEKWIVYPLEKELMWTWLWSHTTLIECQWSNVQAKKKHTQQNIFLHFQIIFWSVFVWTKKGNALGPR